MKSKFHELSTQELSEKESDLKAELFNLRFQHATGQLTNPLALRECRRNIARVKTIMCERDRKASTNQ